MENLVAIEYRGRRVLTTQQLAEGYGTEAQVITNNFNRNRKKYVPGKHYYGIEGEDKRAFLNLNKIDLGLKKAKTLYLWTESGALLHAKSLNTDRAWDVYEALLESYFRQRERMTNESQTAPTYPAFLRHYANMLEENENLKKQEQVLFHKAQCYDLIVQTDDLQFMGDFAKAMNWGRNRLYGFLREQKIFMPNSAIPYQHFCSQGYFEVKYTHRSGQSFPFTLVSPKGMNFIIKKVQKCGIIDELLADKNAV